MSVSEAFSDVPKSRIMLQQGERRSANYHPSIWDPKTIESLSTPFTYELHAAQLDQLKTEAKRLLIRTFQSANSQSAASTLKLVDSMERLGVDYHFVEEINNILDAHASGCIKFPGDLYATALQFRLLRQHAYPVSSEVFDEFKNGNGRFIDDLRNDLDGVLSLYEASYLGFPLEKDLEEARKFSTRHLNLWMKRLESSSVVAKQVQGSLDIPLHWRLSRVGAPSFIHASQTNAEKSLLLLDFAKLDYNIVQSVYQRELKELARWWRQLGFKEKLSFSRDRLMENYLWAVGISSRPQFSKCRIGITKFACILSAIDDMYDIYGWPEELESFTKAVDRWDMKSIEELPTEYLKICYLAMFNFGNEIVYDALRDYGINILPYIKQEWTNLCRSYLEEARWFHKGYTPTVAEYLRNAWTSVGGPAAMTHAFFLQEYSKSTSQLHDFLNLNQGSVIYWSSLLLRLCDDLGTSMNESSRGDVPKIVGCYTSAEGLSEVAAKERVKGLIEDSWRNLNKECARSKLPKSMVLMAIDMARAAHCIFQNGDGIGESKGLTREHLISLFVNPIH